MRLGNRVAQLNQNYDENINISSNQGKFKTLEEAQRKADTVAASETEDAVVVKNDQGEYEVYGTSEIGALDPAGNSVGKYEIHDFEARVVSFSITKRDTDGERLGGEVRANVARGASSTQATFTANRTENGIVQVGRNTRDFMDYLNPLDSGGDNVQIGIKGEAGVSWGWGGVDVSGGATVTASRDDDGSFLVSVNGSVGADVSAGRNTPAGGARAGLGGTASAGVTYRFRTAQEASNFLVHSIRQNMPGATTIFPQLANVPNMNHVKPITRAALAGRVFAEGSVKIGKLEVAGGASFSYEASRARFPNGRTSSDWSATGSINLGVSGGLRPGQTVGVKLDASVNRYHVEYHPAPENSGDYVAVNGNLTFSFTAKDMADFKLGQQDTILNAIIKTGDTLGLTGSSLKSFEDAMLKQIQTSMDKGDFGRSSSGQITMSIGVQAQWEVQPPNPATGERPDNRLQYLRLGMGASTSASVGFDAGVARAQLSAGVSNMDYRNIVTGQADRTYLQGLFFESPTEYARYRQDMGGPSAIVEGKTLAEWERAWRTPGFDRTAN